MRSNFGISRRSFLAAMAAGAAWGGSGKGRAALPAPVARRDSALLALDLSAAAAAIRRGDITAEDHARAGIAQLRRLAALNAFISFDSEALLEAARGADVARAGGRISGPLHGVALAIKDNIETAALPTTAGTEALRHFRPGRDAPVVARLLAAGGLVMGKTNMHELAIGATSNNHSFGAVRNPYRPGYHPGGSSGGTAAAVAARITPAGLGTDTAGSVRMPAALCGIVGLRPATGRYPGAGVVPLSVMRDTVGPMARSVADVVLLDGILSGRPVSPATVGLKGVRIGVPQPHFWENLEPETARVAERALAILADAGAELIEAPMPDVVEINARIGLTVIVHEALRDLPRYLAESGSGVSFEALVAGITTPNVRKFFDLALKEGADDAARYRETVTVLRPALQRAYAAYFRRHDLAAVVFPTTPLASRPIEPNDLVSFHGDMVYARVYLQNIDASANAGLPAITVPAGLTPAGLPVGIEFDAPVGAEKSLFEIAAAFEAAAPPLPPPAMAF